MKQDLLIYDHAHLVSDPNRRVSETALIATAAMGQPSVTVVVAVLCFAVEKAFALYPPSCTRMPINGAL